MTIYQTKNYTVVRKHNKPRPVLRFAASRGFLELSLTKNVIRSSHGHSTPSLKMSCKFVHPFARNVADKNQRKKQTKKKINKEIDGTAGKNRPTTQEANKEDEVI